MQRVRRRQRSRFCAAASAAPFLLTTAPTRTSSCWGGRQDERGRRSGQPRTPTSAAAAQTGADAPAALLEARTAVALLEEARTATVADGSMESAAFTGSVALSPDRYRGYHGLQAVVRDVGLGGGWPTLTKTNYVEWAAVRG